MVVDVIVHRMDVPQTQGSDDVQDNSMSINQSHFILYIHAPGVV
jgi:hypothetical protein